MELVNKFHQMEKEYALFELGKELEIPLWDIIRYNVYVKYYYPSKDRKKQSLKHVFGLKYYLKLLLKIIYQAKVLIFNGGKIIFFTSSRYTDEKGFYYDKSAKPLIELTNKKKIAIESTFNDHIPYINIYNISFVSSKIFAKNKIDKSILNNYYKRINIALEETFNENLLSFEDMCAVLKQYFGAYYYYKFIFRLKKTKNIFISVGNPKAQIKAAQEQKIKSYLVQHAGIEFDEIDYSYPDSITPSSNILYPEILLTLGNYWGQGINIPVKEKLVIGNDFFNNKPDISTDESILIISSIVHGRELTNFTKKIASSREDLNFVYKLHPNEFHLLTSYIQSFKDNKNVKIVTVELDTNILIAKCQLVILIVSAVLYEALNQNKKVAVLKKINYKRQEKLSHLSNLYFFEKVSEVNDILTKKTKSSTVDFYKPLDVDLIKNIFANI